MKILALALLMPTLTLPIAAGQASDPAAVTAIVADYVERIENDDMSLMVVHLNDLTTDAFFSAPTKYSLRAQARQNLMFFIAGVAKRDLTVDTDYELVQISSINDELLSFRTTPVNIFNFESGTRISADEGFQGVISTPSRRLNLRPRSTSDSASSAFGSSSAERRLTGWSRSQWGARYRLDDSGDGALVEARVEWQGDELVAHQVGDGARLRRHAGEGRLRRHRHRVVDERVDRVCA